MKAIFEESYKNKDGTVKYILGAKNPDTEDRIEALRFEGIEVEIRKAEQEPASIEPTLETLDAQFDRIQDAIDKLRRQLRHERENDVTVSIDSDTFSPGIDPNLEPK